MRHERSVVVRRNRIWDSRNALEIGSAGPRRCGDDIHRAAHLQRTNRGQLPHIERQCGTGDKRRCAQGEAMNGGSAKWDNKVESSSDAEVVVKLTRPMCLADSGDRSAWLTTVCPETIWYCRVWTLLLMQAFCVKVRGMWPCVVMYPASRLQHVKHRGAVWRYAEIEVANV